MRIKQSVLSLLTIPLALLIGYGLEANYKGPLLYGKASWYGERDRGVRKHTTSGETFDEELPTCASWMFPLHTVVKVTHLETGRSIRCRINDRGPAKRLHRLIDLSKDAFEQLSDLKLGLIDVSVKRL